MARRTSGATVVAAVFVLITAVPAHAQQRSGADRRGEVERELDLARASNAAVEAEVGRLNQAVTRQQAVVAAARQAEQAAQVQVEAASRKLAEIESRAREAKEQLARRAVAAYVHPRAEGGLALYSEAASLGEIAQRRALVAVVQGRTTEVVGQLRAAREDQDVATRQLEVAREAATERAEAEASEAGRLVAEQRVQQAAHDELAARIAGLQAESQALAAEAAELEARIRQRSAPATAQAPAPQAGAAQAAPAQRSGSVGSGMIWPVGGVVTSEYGPRWGSFHSGIDIGAPEGTPIRAARGGTVISAGWLGGYGNLVVIDHGGGISTAYAHQSRIAAAQGEQVGQGDVIGYVGSTGVSTGNHLHFEVRSGGGAQNPRGYLP